MPIPPLVPPQNPAVGYRVTLPVPPTANRLWRHRGRGNYPTVYLSADGRAYRDRVWVALRQAGIRQPIPGPVALSLRFFPTMPKNGQKRLAKHGPWWHLSVKAVDLDNVNKALFDSLKGIAFGDDRLVHRIVSNRMPPDGLSRVEVEITPLMEVVCD